MRLSFLAGEPLRACIIQHMISMTRSFAMVSVIAELGRCCLSCLWIRNLTLSRASMSAVSKQLTSGHVRTGKVPAMAIW